MRQHDNFFKKSRHCAFEKSVTEFGKKRDYFDFNNLTDLNQYRLKIASGYNATMDRYGDHILLCTEVAFKLLNDKTVLESMNDIINKCRENEYKQNCIESLVGQTIMTRFVIN